MFLAKYCLVLINLQPVKGRRLATKELKTRFRHNKDSCQSITCPKYDM